ncbi:S1 RNA-binding domain-containing protein [Nocardioides sp. NPDC057577]|uniref:S1 RNA-binding domain-containing protein n=1 Tax=Nocardioides sp. NPDC057577 TaxID=3346171 RepID=UPI00367103DE
MTRPSREWAAFESRSAPSDEQWSDAVRRYTAGLVVDGMVFSHHRFGFFIDLGEPIIGLIEIPMLFDDPVRPLSQVDYPPVGSHVRAVVLGTTDHNRQIRLSMRPSDLKSAHPDEPLKNH